MHNRIRQPATLSGLAIGLIFGIGAVAPAHASSQSPQWVWTLYADNTPIVLAHEIPDTPNLQATLQCDPQSNRVQITLYKNAPFNSGPVVLHANGMSQQTASSQVTTTSRRVQTALPANHPTFSAFAASGKMKLEREGQTMDLIIEPPYLGTLRRFAQACSA